MLPRQQALWCLRCRNSIASLPTSPSDFSGAHIACFHGSRPCHLCGAAPLVYIRLGSCNAFGLRKCIKYANRRLGCKRAIGSELAFGLQIGVWAAIWVLAEKWCSNLFENRPFGLSGAALLCFLDNRPCGVCGAAVHLRPGPTVVFSGTRIACFPNRLTWRLSHGTSPRISEEKKYEYDKVRLPLIFCKNVESTNGK